MGEIHTPVSGTKVIGYEYLGRGPGLTGGTGWSRTADLTYRCAQCGILMPANHDDHFICDCGSMYVDWDMFRFGSRHGDQNILVYRRKRLLCPYPVEREGDPDLDALRAYVVEYDHPYYAEAPPDFDEPEAVARVREFIGWLEPRTGRHHALETEAAIQDASFHSQVDLGGGWLRFSAFGNMAAIDDPDQVDPGVVEIVRRLCVRHGYVYVPPEIARTPYTGSNPGVSGFRDWWGRFFDFI